MLLSRNAPESDPDELKEDPKIIFSAIIFWICLSIAALILIFSLMVEPQAHAASASWYGTTGDTCDPWRHTRTASGQRFDENKLTAASWAFPLKTRLRVTNLANDRSVVVLVNDRGPSKRLARKGRILDLSREAFRRIADLKIGIIKVKIERI